MTEFDNALSNLAIKTAEEREKRIREAMSNTHLWVADNLPMSIAAKVMEHLGYRILVERPDVRNIEGDQFKFQIRSRWADVVNGSHEPHGDSGYYHPACWTRVLERTHDAEVFQE